ncbi:MAG TPA: sialate O-acetylesterase [Verrucomicrobiae bacterium]
MKRSRFWLLAALLPFAVSARAELQVGAIFGDNMVLQQKQPVPVWGWAEPKTKVTVTFAGQTRVGRTDARGRWVVTLSRLKASFQPQTLEIRAGETRTFTNVLVGEVWLASGQSNMEKPIGKQPGQKPTFNAAAELAAADYPNIRIFKIGKKLAAGPLPDLLTNSGWLPCSSNTLDGIHFSAAAYFFGREIHTNLNVPIGLIDSTWGGTRIEPWTPPQGFVAFPSLTNFLHASASTNKISNKQPMAIYNAMIAPIAGFAMRGALWYQGESNLMGTNTDNDYLSYETKMKALVGGWRQVWGEGDFPFYFVQIAPFKYYAGKQRRANSPAMLPEFWTIQSQAARDIKKTGMVVTTDLVDNLDDIHPRDKASVGHRLALLARNKTYGEAAPCSGPVFRSARFTGGEAILKFDHGNGMNSWNNEPLSWFEIAGADGKFVPAEAMVMDDTIRVSAESVKQPKAVRFAWAETAQPNLRNEDGLPAEPFSTKIPRK